MKVASGGKDNQVLVWSLSDYQTSLSSSSPSSEKSKSTSLTPSSTYTGHTANVEDVQFQPGSSTILCSGGDDHMLYTWDARSGTSSTASLKFGDDVNTISWNPQRNYQVLAGTSEGKIHLVDTRKMGSKGAFKSTLEYVQTISTDQGPIMCLSWALHNTSSSQVWCPICIFRL